MDNLLNHQLIHKTSQIEKRNMTTNPDPKALTSSITSSLETYLTRLSALNKTPDFTSPFPEIIHDETSSKQSSTFYGTANV